MVDAATRYLENHKYVDELEDVLYDDELYYYAKDVIV